MAGSSMQALCPCSSQGSVEKDPAQATPQGQFMALNSLLWLQGIYDMIDPAL